MLVFTIQTVCTDTELCKALIEAWQEIYKYTPSKQSIYTIIAQHYVETGNKQCWNNNLCNIKYVSSNGNVDYCALNGVWEIVNGVRIDLKPTDPGSWFRSFPTLKDGCVFYLNFIHSARYSKAWSAIENGDPALFSHLLKTSGYYTASEKTYTDLLMSFYNRYSKATIYEDALSQIQAEQAPKPADPLIEPAAEIIVERPSLPVQLPMNNNIFTSVIGFFQGFFKK